MPVIEQGYTFQPKLYALCGIMLTMLAIQRGCQLVEDTRNDNGSESFHIAASECLILVLIP